MTAFEICMVVFSCIWGFICLTGVCCMFMVLDANKNEFRHLKKDVRRCEHEVDIIEQVFAAGSFKKFFDKLDAAGLIDDDDFNECDDSDDFDH
jgi:hypothetical protein